MRFFSFLVLSALLLAAQKPGNAQEGPLGGSDNPVMIDIPDSLLGAPVVVDTAPETPVAFSVRGARIQATQSPTVWRLSASKVETTDGGSLEDVVRVLPAARPATNSRGETVFTVRGAPERHVQVTLDGIPLVVPWDERSDLSLIPTDAVGAVDVDRGVATTLGLPNALAGTVRLQSRRLTQAGQRTRLGWQIGEVNAWQARGLHVRATDNWNVLVAASHRTRDAFLLPLDRTLERNQFDRQARTNSDLRQTAGLVRVARTLPRDGELAVLVQVADAERGVAPESHVDDPRLWRLPNTQRMLVGVSSQFFLDAEQAWPLRAMVAVDKFHQEIREFDDLTYTTPDLADGVDFEEDDDLTLTARLEGHHDTAWGRFAAQGHVRHTNHEETLTVGGAAEMFSQRIVSVSGEWSRQPRDDWFVRAGAGVEQAASPDSGDKPSVDTETAPVLSAGITRLFPQGHLEARVSRKSRFPSLRELYSGALGRFVPNFDLKPEHQTLVELSALRRTDRAEVSVGFFGGLVDGLIERQVVDAQTGQFSRVNVDDFRTLGVEFSGSIRPATGLALQLHHLFLHARAKSEGSFDQKVEDRPDFLTQAIASYEHGSGTRLQAEWVLTGPRESADPGAEDGLTTIDAQSQLNARIGYRYFSNLAHLAHIEAFVRVNNVFDADVDSQFGLPDPGRMVTAGVRVGLD